MEDCRKRGRLGPTPISDCERNRAEKGGPNVCELVMESLRHRHREETEQKMEVDWSGDGSL